MRVLRDFFCGAETHPEEEANKEQHDIIHCMISERLPVSEVAVGNESLKLNGTGCAPENFLNSEALRRPRSGSPCWTTVRMELATGLANMHSRPKTQSSMTTS